MPARKRISHTKKEGAGAQGTDEFKKRGPEAELLLQNELNKRKLLNAAAFGAKDKVLRLLIFVDIDAKDEFGANALMRAADTGQSAVVELLIEHGADVNARDKNGCTALMRAVICGHAGVIALLLAHGADAQAVDNYGVNALTKARRRRNAVVMPDEQRNLEGIVEILTGHQTR